MRLGGGQSLTVSSLSLSLLLTRALSQNEGSELKDLVSLMRTDYENMSRQDGKQRVVMENALQRNKMLVKGGSSFNALIRALKQDLVDR